MPCFSTSGRMARLAELVFNASNTPETREHAVFGDPLELIWKRCIFGLCGVTRVHRRTFSVVVTSTAAQRAQWLEKAQELARSVFRQ